MLATMSEGQKKRSPAQEQTARENLAKANKLAFSKRDAALAAAAEAKPKTYRAGTGSSSGKPTSHTEPAAAPVPAAGPRSAPASPSAREPKKGLFDDVLGSIFK
jgi:hypothetical protein